MSEQATELQIPVTCNVWKSTLFKVTPTGLSCRCKSCRGSLHEISRERLEAMWDELKRQMEQGEKPKTA